MSARTTTPCVQPTYVYPGVSAVQVGLRLTQRTVQVETTSERCCSVYRAAADLQDVLAAGKIGEIPEEQ